jgi:hypothetical protein
MVEISFMYQENDCANRLYGKIVLKMVNVNEINIHNLIKPIIINAITPTGKKKETKRSYDLYIL